MNRLRLPQPSLLGLALTLSIGVVLLVAGVAVGLIFAARTPFTPPLTAYEIGRLLEGRSIVQSTTGVTVATETTPPRIRRDENQASRLVRAAIADQLGRPIDDVRFRGRGLRESRDGQEDDARRFFSAQRIEREYELYANDGRFNPSFFDGFTAALKQDDGRWRVVRRESRDPLSRWRWTMIGWIALAVLLVVPIAWWFSRRLAEPIRAFAAAADRIGSRQQVQPVDVRGPKEIRLAARSLNDMQARLQRYLAERTSMVGAIAHDLRTPLARLAFHLALAPDALRGRAEAEIAEMEAMIAATLDFVQNEARSRAHEALDLSLLVEGVVDDFADTGANARMAEAAAVTVTGDAMLLRRLFSNLIANALAYGEAAEVSVRVAGGNAIVDIADRGPGLSPADLERAFEPFYRAETSRNRATGGIGLGLAIARTAAGAHGGDLVLANREGGGLRATVTLPLG